MPEAPSACRCRPGRILVGVDGSERSVDALAFGRLLAERAGASLSVGCVYGAAHAFGPLGSEAEACAAIRDVSRRAAWPDEHRNRLMRDSPAAGLRRLIGEEAAEIVVVGSSHRSGVGRVLPRERSTNYSTGLLAPSRWRRTDSPLQRDAGLRVTGVGFDGSDESRAALATAESLALTAGGAVRVFCVLPEGAPHSLGANGLGRPSGSRWSPSFTRLRRCWTPRSGRYRHPGGRPRARAHRALVRGRADGPRLRRGRSPLASNARKRGRGAAVRRRMPGAGRSARAWRAPRAGRRPSFGAGRHPQPFF